MEDQTRPGIHPQVRLHLFPADEQKIIKKLGEEWYITRDGEVFLGPSEAKGVKYRYLLLKPTFDYRELFNLDRELIAIFSPYDKFEPRTFDVIDKVYQKYQSLRLDRICSVIFSKDDNVGAKVTDILRSQEESQIIVPIAYNDYLLSADGYYLKNKFKAYFYNRDLFAFEGPLKKDIYFFGRTDLVHKIVNRHFSNENSGLFGLRKSGKTSVIFGVERALEEKNARSVIIDCHDTSFHQRRWNKALWYILYQIQNKYNLKLKFRPESEYSEENASIFFEEEISKIHRHWGNKNILLIFDEIENMTFGVSPSHHWESSLDFLLFWQALRSVYQRLTNVMSYLIVGTNPLCVEMASIKGKANPIFMSIPFEYIQPFSVNQTTEMVNKLGTIMGLVFDDLVYSRLAEDYGGHPYLIRHVCSIVHKLSGQDRPVEVSRKLYERAKEVFDKEYSGYLEMVIDVLRESFKDEYDMLKYLAIGDIATFHELASLSELFTNHLIGYGLIEKKGPDFDFRIDAIRQYLLKKNKYQQTDLTTTEMWAEISERRNILEPSLRKLIKNHLKAVHGEAKAKEIVIGIFDQIRATKYGHRGYSDLFDPNKSEIYFDDLRKIISKEWNTFMHIFDKDNDTFNSHMKAINKYRTDAHAKELKKDEFAYLRVCFSKIERLVADFS